MMTIKRFRLSAGLFIAGVIGVSLFLSACGGGTSPASPAPQGKVTTPVTAATEIQITEKDKTFPKEIRVKVGDKVVFVVTNSSADHMHTFEIPDFKVYQEIKPGTTVRIEWTVPNKKGDWDIGCFLTDPPGAHEGMEGTLIIE